VNPLRLLAPEQMAELFLQGEEALPGFRSVGLHAYDRDALKSVRAKIGHTFLGIPVFTAVEPDAATDTMAQSDLMIRQTKEGWIIEPGERLQKSLGDFDLGVRDEQALIERLKKIDLHLRRATEKVKLMYQGHSLPKAKRRQWRDYFKDQAVLTSLSESPKSPLSEKEKRILQLYFGLSEEIKPQSFKQMKTEFGLSEVSIRKHLARATQ
jgi:hypothetical protein